MLSLHSTTATVGTIILGGMESVLFTVGLENCDGCIETAT